MPETEQLVRVATAYGVLEKKVLALMAVQCAAFCGRCAAVCCRPVYCREALTSPFLAWVRKVHLACVKWSVDTGWLGPAGCRLTVGRPLVCYEFICNRILFGRPEQRSRDDLKELADLLTGVGRRARAGHHLLELYDWQAVNWERLEKQLYSAQASVDRLTIDCG